MALRPEAFSPPSPTFPPSPHLNPWKMEPSSDAKQPSDETPSSLAGGYEFLSRSMCETSDDEGNTVSLASTEGHSPDDLSSLDGDVESEEDAPHTDEDEYFDDESQHFTLREAEGSAASFTASQYTVSPDDSMTESKPDTQDGEDSCMRLHELPPFGTEEFVQGFRILQGFDNTAGLLPEVLRGFRCSELLMSAKMAMSRRFLPKPRSYRLLYVGDFEPWAMTDVNNHIGAALNAAPGSSRFNIVEGSDVIGSPSSSRVQLERSGSELVVDHCPEPDLDYSGKQKSVTISLDGSSIRFGPRGIEARNPESVPDLVIFGHPTLLSGLDAAYTEGQFRRVRDTMRQTYIPSIDVTKVRPYSDESYDFEPGKLRLCIDGRPSQDAEFEERKTLPIDLYTFLAMDPVQINRHLSYLHDRSASAGTIHMKQMSTSSWSVRNMLPDYTSMPAFQANWWAQRKVWAPIVAMVAMMVLYFAPTSMLGPLGNDPLVEENVVLNNLPKPQPAWHPSPSTSTLIVAKVTPTYSSTLVHPSSETTSTTTTSAATSSTPRELSVHHWIEDLSVLAPFNKLSRRGSYDVEVTGDHDFLLQPSKELAHKIRKPELVVQVHRDSDEIPVQVVRLPNGTFSVHLEQAYSASTFNVSISAAEGKRPLLQQAFEVKLGSDNFLTSVSNTVGRLSKKVRVELAFAQAHVKSGLQAGLVRIEDGAAAVSEQTRQWNRKLQDSSQTVAGHLHEARQKASQQLSATSDVAQDVSKHVQSSWKVYSSRASETGKGLKSSVWQRSRPLRTSQSVLRMRKRALRLRCMIETKLAGKGNELEKVKGLKACQSLKGQALKDRIASKRGKR